MEDYKRIPDYAALITLAGFILAVAGFVATILTEGWLAPLAGAAGLFMVARGLKIAEDTLDKR